MKSEIKLITIVDRFSLSLIHWSTKFLQNICMNFWKKQSWNIEINTKAYLSILTIHVISSSSSSLSSPMNFIEVKRKFRF